MGEFIQERCCMSRMSLIGGDLILQDRVLEQGCLQIVDSLIAEIQASPKSLEDTQIVDLSNKYVCPGFVDLHVHGGLGADFMDGTCAAVRTACRAHLAHGTTTIFPTTSTGSPEQIMAMLNAVSEQV